MFNIIKGKPGPCHRSGMIQRLAILCKIICLFFVGEVCSPYLTQSEVRVVGQEEGCLEEVWRKHSPGTVVKGRS